MWWRWNANTIWKPDLNSGSDISLSDDAAYDSDDQFFGDHIYSDKIQDMEFIRTESEDGVKSGYPGIPVNALGVYKVGS